MSAIKLSEVPVEYSDVHRRRDAFAMRFTNILKKINFPDRNKYVLALESEDWFGLTYRVRMAIEVVDTGTGGTIKLEHYVSINTQSSDEMIAGQVYVLIAQYLAHEFMENFRYEGEILYDPHSNTASHEPIFEAIRMVPIETERKKREERDRQKDDLVIQFIGVDTGGASKPKQQYTLPPFDFDAFHAGRETFKKMAEAIESNIADEIKKRIEAPKKNKTKFWHQFAPLEPWRSKKRTA